MTWEAEFNVPIKSKPSSENGRGFLVGRRRHQDWEVGGLRFTVHQATTPAPAQINAPTAMVQGTPTACDRNPDSMPPNGIMPPKINAQMPITRPRIACDTLVWMSVFVVEK
jgi:hypothetical protein